MTVRIKKLFALISCASVILGFTGCSVIGKAVDNARNGPKQARESEAEEIFGYLMNEDTDSLCALFSPEVSRTHDLENEWKDFFEHLDGKLVSYDSISFPNEGTGTDKDGHVYKEHFSVNYNNAKTDNGTVYKELGYYHIVIADSDPESEGITVFTYQDPATGEWFTVGGE